MVNNESYSKWVDQRTLEYCNSVENLLEPVLENCLSLPERTDLICSVIKLGTVYMEDVVARWGNEFLNRIMTEIALKEKENEKC